MKKVAIAVSILFLLALVFMIINFQKIGIDTIEVGTISMDYPRHWEPIFVKEGVINFMSSDTEVAAQLRVIKTVDLADLKAEIKSQSTFTNNSETKFDVYLLESVATSSKGREIWMLQWEATENFDRGQLTVFAGEKWFKRIARTIKSTYE